jgi:thymidine kinase
MTNSFPTRQGGWIEVICGCMFSGKTGNLMHRIGRAEIADLKVQVFKHSIDVRYANDLLVSHDGGEHSAIPVFTADAIDEMLVEEVQIVAVDEAQFFPVDLVDFVNKWANDGMRVILAGLDLDYGGQPFGPMNDLLANAEMVTKLEAVCKVCKGPATRTQRLEDGHPVVYQPDKQIQVGGLEAYEARCRRHHIVPLPKE